MECFAAIVRALFVNYCCKALDLRCLRKSCIRLQGPPNIVVSHNFPIFFMLAISITSDITLSLSPICLFLTCVFCCQEIKSVKTFLVSQKDLLILFLVLHPTKKWVSRNRSFFFQLNDSLSFEMYINSLSLQLLTNFRQRFPAVRSNMFHKIFFVNPSLPRGLSFCMLFRDCINLFS